MPICASWSGLGTPEMLVTLGDWFGFKVVSMLIESTCRRSMGAVAMMGCMEALGKLPSCCIQYVQVLMDCHIWLVIPSHQKHSCSKDKVQSRLWCPASQWHPFRVVTWCASGTMKSSKSSFLPLGVECRYRHFWWIMKFWCFLKTSQPSLPETCSPKTASDQSSFGLLTSPTQHSALDPLSGLLPSQSHTFWLKLAQWQHIPFFYIMVTFNHCGIIYLCPVSNS